MPSPYGNSQSLVYPKKIRKFPLYQSSSRTLPMTENRFLFLFIYFYFVCFPNGCIEWGGSFHYLSDCRIRCTWASNSRGRWRGWSYICCDQGIQKYLGPWISLSLAYLEILYKLKFIGIKYFFLFGISDNYLT